MYYLSEENRRKICYVIIAIVCLLLLSIVTIVFLAIYNNNEKKIALEGGEEKYVELSPSQSRKRKQKERQAVRNNGVLTDGYEDSKGGFMSYVSSAFGFSSVPVRTTIGITIESIRRKSEEINIKPFTDKTLEYLNVRAYEITERYMKATDNLKDFQKDPLIIMATSRVETGVYTDMNLIYSTAIPTLGVDDWDLDLVDTYGAKETLENDSYWRRLLPSSAKHQGPLQMGIDYGVEDAVIPQDLIGKNEDNELLPWRYLKRYHVPSAWYKTRLVDTGDRYNWGDACNRMIGVMDRWALYYNEFENVYEYIALCGMAHNVGGSLFTAKASTKVNASYFPWKDVGSARMYAKQLITAEVIDYITGCVKADIQKWRDGKQSTPDFGRGLNWRYSVVQQAGVDTSLFTLKGDYKNRLGYPIGCIYYYILLEQLYFNAG